MKKNLASIILLSVFTLPAFAAKPDCANPIGSWENQLGSTLTINSVDPNTGLVTGTYQSPSGTTGEQFPLIGWTNKAPVQPGKDNATLVSFSVRWGSYGSITSWSGLCREENGLATIQALWHLARSNSQYVWDHVLTGNDVFKAKAVAN